jgi:hypothetical protein
MAEATDWTGLPMHISAETVCSHRVSRLRAMTNVHDPRFHRQKNLTKR